MTAPHKSKLTHKERNELWEAKYGRALPPPLGVSGWIEGYASINRTICVWKFRDAPGWGLYCKALGMPFNTHAEAVAYAHKLAQERSQS